MSRNKNIFSVSRHAKLNEQCCFFVKMFKVLPVFGSLAVLAAMSLTTIPASSRTNRPTPPASGGPTPPALPTTPTVVPRPSAALAGQNSGNLGINPSSASFANPPTTLPKFNNSTDL